jgi:hypothetical protein
MTKRFLSRHRTDPNCTHQSRLRTEVAGMSREVCQTCGKVTVGYIEDHFQPGRTQAVEEAIRSFDPGESGD